MRISDWSSDVCSSDLATGTEAMSAYLIAVEASSRIGMAVKGGFHRKGHHPTGLVGAFGCTLAAGYLGDLSEKQMASAQGIVLSKIGRASCRERVCQYV